MKLFFVISILILIEVIASAPPSKEESVDIFFEKGSRDALRKYVETMLPKFHELFKGTINTIESNSTISERLTEKLKEFKNFNADFEKYADNLENENFEQIDRLQSTAESLIKNYRKFDEKLETSDESKLLYQELKKNGLDAVISQSETEAEKINARAQELLTEWTSLAVKQYISNENMIETTTTK